jgi:hypothetical protein
MCILPNFAERNLEELGKNGKRKNKKTKVETVEITVAERSLLENSV